VCQQIGHRHSIFCALPPHLLLEVVRNGGPEDREAALRTLSIDNTQRNLRGIRLAAPVNQALVATVSALGTAQGGRQRTIYDTHNTERYLGDPAAHPESYARSSLVTDDGLSSAADPHRPLLIVHGTADDNVVFAHALRLSSGLLAAGRPHEVLPLSGVTHMTPQEQIAENLLLLQVDFLKRALGLA
jgi:pimeloyl-ACP methyl ester carboxylesterase